MSSWSTVVAIDENWRRVEAVDSVWRVWRVERVRVEESGERGGGTNGGNER